MWVHVPVLPNEVFSFLRPRSTGELMIDGTLGQGGHAERFLSEDPGLAYIGIDADAEMLESAKRRLAAFADRVSFVNAWFDEFLNEYPASGRPAPDTIFLDLGISMFHYTDSGRGFSFQKDEEPDMRLDVNSDLRASEIVNRWRKEELVRILTEYGEERFASRIASAILARRMEKPIRGARELADIVAKAVPVHQKGFHPATLTFQALRIAVNDELGRLTRGLDAGFRILKDGGRFGVIAFHSLEDRIVKNFFRLKNRDCICPKEVVVCRCGGEKEAELLTKKPIVPSPEEAERNPASRSAKLRVVRKIHDRRLAA